MHPQVNQGLSGSIRAIDWGLPRLQAEFGPLYEELEEWLFHSSSEEDFCLYCSLPTD